MERGKEFSKEKFSTTYLLIKSTLSQSNTQALFVSLWLQN